jgi:DNA-binding Xre family transcriptional regulator
MSNKHIGSNFNDFLEEEGILAETDSIAVKRVIAFQVEQMMIEQKLSKTEMSRRMNTSRAALNRLLDPANRAVTLQTLDRAARALGKRLQISIG